MQPKNWRSEYISVFRYVWTVLKSVNLSNIFHIEVDSDLHEYLFWTQGRREAAHQTEVRGTALPPGTHRYHHQWRYGKGPFTLSVNVCVCVFEKNEINGRKTQMQIKGSVPIFCINGNVLADTVLNFCANVDVDTKCEPVVWSGDRICWINVESS